MRRILPLATVAMILGAATARAADGAKVARPAGSAPAAKAEDRVFEIRTYYTLPGRAEALHKRFREHTCDLFKKHGMELVGFWTPRDEKKKGTLIYILAFPSRDAADKAWKDFGADPEWQKVRAESEQDGKIVDRVEREFLDPTDYSPIK